MTLIQFSSTSINDEKKEINEMKEEKLQSVEPMHVRFCVIEKENRSI